MNLSSLTPLASAFLCLLSVSIWLAMAWAHGRGGRHWALARLSCRVVCAIVFWQLIVNIAEQLLETSPAWPTWGLTFLAAAVTETVFLCTAAESSLASRFCVGAWWPLPRILATGLLAVMLLQPTRSFEQVKESVRTVAVVMDISDSMNLPARRDADDQQSRRQISEQLLGDGDGAGLLHTLQQRYNVNVYLMGATAQPLSASAESAPATWSVDIPEWSQSTSVAATLRRICGDAALSELSGVVLLTDGCDHSENELTQAAAALRNHQVPCSSVVIGSREPVRDGEIALHAPTQIYEGDELELAATVRVDRLPQQTAGVRLYADDQLLEERALEITSERHRQTVRFRHRPEVPGIHTYRAELTGLIGERTVENNTASVETWVSRDSLRVLLVDGRPRWEFRYLRNLLAGRDRSIYLQAVLLQPDRLAGVPAPATVHASALRAFDDCQANALPATEADWRKFDVIILGDISPLQLGAVGLEAVQRFVQDQGGSLVLLAGQSHMPHAYRGTPLENLSPAVITGMPPGVASQSAVRLRPTTAGQNHVVLQRAGMTTEKAWSAFPPLSWRHPSSQAKVGAEVLAWASGAQADLPLQQQRERSLMLWHRCGAGRVLQLNFDESWRLRYGVGDRIHHQFWGQIVRWCASERLSVGTDLVRLGTDRLLYAPGDVMQIRARLLDELRNPVASGDIRAELSRDDEVVRSVVLSPDDARTGLLTGQMPDLPAGGRYRLSLAGTQVNRLLQQDPDGVESVGLEIAVRSTSTGREMLDIVADDTVPRQLADWTGGTVVDSKQAQRVLSRLGPPSSFERRRWSTPLWNTWPMIAAFLGCLCFEWTLRRINGRV